MKFTIYYQDLNPETQADIFMVVKDKLVLEGLSEQEAMEEADHYINTHNVANEFQL